MTDQPDSIERRINTALTWVEIECLWAIGRAIEEFDDEVYQDWCASDPEGNPSVHP